MRKINISIIIAMLLFPARLSLSYINAAEVQDSSLIESKRIPHTFEIGNIQFVGNVQFSGDELSGVISSKPSTRSIQHSYFEQLALQIDKNKYSPKLLKISINKTVKSYSHELRFFNEIRASNDVEALKQYYNKNGFHDASVYYSFLPDSRNKINVLTFYITENSQYHLSRITYLGLYMLPQYINEEINKRITIKSNVPFNEGAITDEISKVIFVLQDNGYYYANLTTKPVVKKDTTQKRDSVIVSIKPGLPQRVSHITFIDSADKQPLLAFDAKKEQIEFSEGDWFSISKLRRSEDNLRYLGTFEYVNIDTSTVFFPKSDTSLSFRVLLQYRLLQEGGVAPFINQTSFDKVVNAGFEVYYSHKNIFGKAQVLNPYLRISTRDVSRTLQHLDSAELEGQVGLKYGQSILWTIDNAKIGLFLNPYFSYRGVFNLFELLTIALPVRFPVKQPTYTYIGSMIFDFTFQRDKPIKFRKVKETALDSTSSLDDSLRVQQSLLLYENLDKYVNTGGFKLMTASIASISLIGDHRDNFFSPTSGDYFSVAVDGSPFIPIVGGIAKFIRLQAVYYFFHSFNKYTVLATKLRIGHIFRWDEDNGYVPNDRQFFAGGANSVRGWPSRKLRYTTFKRDTTMTGSYFSFLEDFVGNATIIEGSVEARYQLQRSARLGETLSDILSSTAFVLFLDFGNSFNWFVSTEEQPIKFSDYFTKLAAAAGFGLRYNTPVGPLRFDFGWRIYDPLAVDGQFIWQKPLKIFEQFHFGIGHAF